MKFKGLIYDFGMHEGQDTIHYLRQGFRVIAVEANPELTQKTGDRLKEYINTGQLTILPVGVSDTPGIMAFYKNHYLSEWSSFDRSIGTRNNTSHSVIDIECVTPASIFTQYERPFYVKVDIEGFDHIVLNDLDTEQLPDFVSCEASDFSYFDLLHSKGYTQFKLLNQARDFEVIDLEKEKNKFSCFFQNKKNRIKLRLQQYVPFTHPYGSSGPFGDRTKGAWMLLDEVKSLYHQFYDPVSGKPLNDMSWFDIHAKLD